MTIPEAAAYLRLHEQTLVRLVRAREIPARKVGGSWRLSKRQLLALVEAGEESAAEAQAAQDTQGGREDQDRSGGG